MNRCSQWDCINPEATAKKKRRAHMAHNMPDRYTPYHSKLRGFYDHEGWPMNPYRSLLHKGRKRKLTQKDLYRKVDLKLAREEIKWQKEQDRIERERERNRDEWDYDPYPRFDEEHHYKFGSWRL